jgi:DNA-binding NtrC family response regulator
LAVLAQWQPDVVILDIRMPGMGGMTALKQIKETYPLVEVILLTGHGAIDTAVDGLKSGAFDYLLKPAPFDQLLTTLEAARRRKAEQEERIRRAEARSLIRRSGDV